MKFQMKAVDLHRICVLHHVDLACLHYESILRKSVKYAVSFV